MLGPSNRDSDLDRQLENTEQINHSIIGVLANSGYRLSLPITMPGDRGTMVYFFIHDPEHTRAEVRAPTVARAGMGEKGGLSTYQPVVTKSRQSFYKTVTRYSLRCTTRCTMLVLTVVAGAVNTLPLPVQRGSECAAGGEGQPPAPGPHQGGEQGPASAGALQCTAVQGSAAQCNLTCASIAAGLVATK
jgi:hypothetical protein